METNNKNKFIAPIVIAVIVILIAGIGYFFKSDAPSTTSETATTTTSGTEVKTSAPTTGASTPKPIVASPAKPVPATNQTVSGKSSIELLSPDGDNGFAIDASSVNASIPVSFRSTGIQGIAVYLVNALGKSVSSAVSEIENTQNSYIFRVNQGKSVSVIPTGDYKIKLCDAKNVICDTSEKTFKITSITTAAPTVSLVAPNGGESWKIGTAHNISFSATGNLKPEYKVKLTLGPKEGTIVTLPASASSYSWTLPKDICWSGDVCGTLSAGYYKIRASLYDENDELITLDESDMSITITN